MSTKYITYGEIEACTYTQKLFHRKLKMNIESKNEFTRLTFFLSTGNFHRINEAFGSANTYKKKFMVVI